MLTTPPIIALALIHEHKLSYYGSWVARFWLLVTSNRNQICRVVHGELRECVVRDDDLVLDQVQSICNHRSNLVFALCAGQTSPAIPVRRHGNEHMLRWRAGPLCC